MNILYTLGSGTYGGMEFHVLDLVKGMKQKGHNIYVWCDNGEIVNEFRRAGATVVLRTPKSEIDVMYIFALSRYLKAEKVDILHSHELKVVVNSLFAGVLARVKVKVSHTHTPISKWQISKFKKFINTIFNALMVNIFSDREIALTEIVRQQKILEGITPKKLAVIGNTVDFNRFRPKTLGERALIKKRFTDKYSIPENAFIFGNISRLTKEKGHEVLIRAFAEVSRDFESRLLICGGGSLHKEYTKLIRELGIEEKVIITGYFEENHKENFFAIFDAFVFPSLAEGFGIVLLEAVASEIPVLASDLDVFMDIFSDKIEYFKSGDIRDLIKKMSDFKNSEYTASSSKTKMAYGQIMQKYSFENFINSYEKLYESLINK